MHHPEVTIPVAVVTAAMSARMRTEEEPAEEDDGDDEDDACHDADPRGDRRHSRSPGVALDIGRLGRGGGCHRRRRRFRC
jgi:hypothetical protein